MDEIFREELNRDEIIVYMDDILIFGETEKELHQKTLHILQKLRDNDLYLKPEKCVFAKKKVEY